jgi:hypothetical protein
VECGILKRFPVKVARSQAGFLLNIILKLSSVKAGLAVVGQGGNTGTPRPPALHLHFVELNPCGIAFQKHVQYVHLSVENVFPINQLFQFSSSSRIKNI